MSQDSDRQPTASQVRSINESLAQLEAAGLIEVKWGPVLADGDREMEIRFTETGSAHGRALGLLPND